MHAYSYSYGIIKYEYAASAKETEIEIEKEGQRDRATETDSDVIEAARPGLINYVYYIRRSAYGGKKKLHARFSREFFVTFARVFFA